MGKKDDYKKRRRVDRRTGIKREKASSLKGLPYTRQSP
jgi:hypothetical protein